MNEGDTIFIKISSLDNLALTDLRDFFRCLKYIGMREEDIDKLSKRHFDKIQQKIQEASNQN